MEMEYRRLGRSGIRVSVLSFGSWVTFEQATVNGPFTCGATSFTFTARVAVPLALLSSLTFTVTMYAPSWP